FPPFRLDGGLHRPDIDDVPTEELMKTVGAVRSAFGVRIPGRVVTALVIATLLARGGVTHAAVGGAALEQDALITESMYIPIPPGELRSQGVNELRGAATVIVPTVILNLAVQG